jgi:uncharacterized protein
MLPPNDKGSAMNVIDADTHVIESERIWDFFDEDMAHRKPTLVPWADPNNGDVKNFWIIDSKLVPHPAGKGGQALATPPIENEILESTAWLKRAMIDINARLDDATGMGVDTQIIYPTLFIGFLTHDVELEVAMARAYNRFMADACSRSNGRMRWVVVPPLRDLDRTMEELNFGKENGACGVLFRGVEKDRSLAEPYFFPVYEEAQRLGLPICVHTGPGSPTLTEFFDSRLSFVFPDVRLLPVMAFYDLACSKIPERFPDLRWGFIEANSSWVPYLVHFLHRRLKIGRDKFGPEYFQNNRLYIACEADEDIPYILQYVGEDNMITGSDYGHGDQSAEPDLVNLLREREDVSPSIMQKILGENAMRFYGL